MKIKQVKFNNHKVLGDLEVDFTDESGGPMDTIVFIGDNGTGKTQVLETIVKMLEDDWKRHESQYKGYQLVGRSEKNGKKISSYSRFGFDLVSYVEGNEFTTLTESYEETQSHAKRKTSLDIKDFNLPVLFDGYRHEPYDLKPEVIWMPAELNIDKDDELNKSEQKNSIVRHANHWSLGDVSDYIVKTINRALHKAIIEATDRSAKEIYDNECKTINDIFKDLNLNVRLIGLSTGEKPNPLFKNKKGEEIDIQSLSSGEKQLFFRLLSLKSLNLNDAIIIIDEPEASLHPEWQRKIINVYRKIGQNNQLIIATHSPLIVGSVPTESVRIMSRSDEGIIQVEQGYQTYGKSAEHILNVTMNLDSLRDEKTTEKLNDLKSLLDADKYDSEAYLTLLNELKKQLGSADEEIMLIEMGASRRRRQHAKYK